MLRQLLAALSILTLTTLATPDEPKKEKTMDGSWQLVSGVLGGKDLPEEFTKSAVLVLKEGKYTLKSSFGDDSGTCRVDATKTPKELDVTGVEGPNKGKSYQAIYELDGDTLKVCYDMTGKARPTEFKSPADTKLFLAVYNRKKE